MKKNQVNTFFRIGAIYKKLTKTTQKIWQPAFESLLAARCKGPDKVKKFFESLPPKEHPHISLVEPPRSGHKLIFLSIFLYPVLETENIPGRKQKNITKIHPLQWLVVEMMM